MNEIYCFKDTSQVSKKSTYSFELPKYPASTTDPTYYEPTATRIANMRKSASSMQTLYDFEGDDATKFADGKSALKNLNKASLDPRFNNFATREEISQITQDLSDKVQNIVDNKKNKRKQQIENINEALRINNVLETTIQNNSTNDVQKE